MNRYYHFTSYENFGKIKEEGLKPQLGDRSKSIGDTNFGVYFSKGIDQSVLMYAYMLGLYEKFIGPEGDKKIEQCNQEIHKCEQAIKNGGSIVQNRMDISNKKAIISSVDLLRSFKSFYDYIGGPCCILSVGDLEGIKEFSPDNCLYRGTISPDKISVVNIINNQTGEPIALLDPVLAYVMSCFPIEHFLQDLSEKNKMIINRLYYCKNMLGYAYYNPYNYFPLEIPITSYVKQDIKVKTLTNR